MSRSNIEEAFHMAGSIYAAGLLATALDQALGLALTGEDLALGVEVSVQHPM